MNEKKYLEAFEAGVKAAHDSLEPLLRAYMDCVMELEVLLEPGEISPALEQLEKELKPRILGGNKNENEGFN